MGRNATSSVIDLQMERILDDSYDRGWKDCKKAIIEILNKTYNIPAVEDLSNIIKIIEKV
jgi:hypothetical protein